MKRVFSILLCIAMIFSAAAMLGSCNKDGDDGEKTSVTTAPGGEVDLYGDLPQGSYDDYQFNILVAESNYGLTIMDAEDTSSKINEAVYNRNRYIEQELSVEFNVEQKPNGETRNEMSKIAKGGDHVYDICFNEAHMQAVLAREGVYIGVNSYDDKINFNKPWWYDSDMESVTIGEKSFFLMGDIQMMRNDSTWCIAFNKEILAQHGVENPYELVKNKQWTFEELYQMIQDTKKDDENDRRYGIVSHITYASACLAAGGVELIKKGSNGKLTLTAADETLVNVYSDTLKYFFDSNGDTGTNWIRTAYASQSWNGGSGEFDGVDFQGKFTSGKATFMGGTVGDMRTYLPKSEIDYGIVPMPMYNPDIQTQYTGYVFEGAHACAVPMTMPSMDALTRTCTVLEWLGAYSYQMLRPVYYDEIIKARTANDPESAEMLDIVFGYNELGKNVFELDNIFKLGTAESIQVEISDRSASVTPIINGSTRSVNKLLEGYVETFMGSGDYNLD